MAVTALLENIAVAKMNWKVFALLINLQVKMDILLSDKLYVVILLLVSSLCKMKIDILFLV